VFFGFLSRQISTKNSKNLINSANATLNSSRSPNIQDATRNLLLSFFIAKSG
jgi:hypothetical protein